MRKIVLINFALTSLSFLCCSMTFNKCDNMQEIKQTFRCFSNFLAFELEGIEIERKSWNLFYCLLLWVWCRHTTRISFNYFLQLFIYEFSFLNLMRFVEISVISPLKLSSNKFLLMILSHHKEHPYKPLISIFHKMLVYDSLSLIAAAPTTTTLLQIFTIIK